MYIKIQTKQEYSEAQIRSEFPNTSFPTPFLPPTGFSKLFDTPVPEHNSTIHVARQATPVLTNKGVWEQRWEIVNKYQEHEDENGVIHTIAEQAAAAIAAEAKARVPKSVTMRQARLALLGTGKLAAVEAAIAEIEPETAKQAIKIEWEYAQTVDRESTWVAALAPALSLTEEQLDGLFTVAATL